MKKEEAIKELRSFIGQLTEGCQDVIKVLIPELRESEDERMRQRIIKAIRLRADDMNEEWSDEIAWLEKQKPAETPQWMIDFLNDIRTASINKEGYDDYDGRREYEGKILAIIRWLEGNFIQQKEQKAAVKLVFPKFRVGDIIRNVRDKWDKTTKRISYVGEHGYNFDYRHLGDKAGGGSFGFCFEDYYELVEQKPAEWNYPYGVNETADRLFAIAECLEMDGDCLFNGYSGTECGKFLRELARKQVEYKPAEWSEEDEKKIHFLSRLIELQVKNTEYCFSKGYFVSKQAAIEMLKSLRPHLKQEQPDVDLEKTVEFECIGKKVKMTVQELINYYIDSKCADVADECGL